MAKFDAYKLTKEGMEYMGSGEYERKTRIKKWEQAKKKMEIPLMSEEAKRLMGEAMCEHNKKNDNELLEPLVFGQRYIHNDQLQQAFRTGEAQVYAKGFYYSVKDGPEPDTSVAIIDDTPITHEGQAAISIASTTLIEKGVVYLKAYIGEDDEPVIEVIDQDEIRTLN